MRLDFTGKRNLGWARCLQPALIVIYQGREKAAAVVQGTIAGVITTRFQNGTTCVEHLRQRGHSYQRGFHQAAAPIS
jgi:hypothetical protein